MWENIVCFPTQRYNAPSSRFRIKFVSTISVELDSMRAWKWNYKQVIVFQSVILQCIWLVTDAKNIHAEIEFWLDCWNCGPFEKLRNNTCTAAMGSMERARGNQSRGQRHPTFSNIVLRRKMCGSVRFFCERYTAGVFQPKKLALDKTGIINKTVASVLAGKHLHEPPLPPPITQ